MAPGSPISVAVIPCAGEGTRMLPATRVVPKPLTTLIDRPVVQHVVEEAVDAGVTEIVLVVDDRPLVMSHFANDPPLEGLEKVEFVAVRQDRPAGLGDAVLTAREAVGDRPFLCMLSDMVARPGTSLTRRMVELFDGRPVVALRRVAEAFFDRYGIVEIDENITGDVVEVLSAVEKPGGDAPSDLGILGRYVLTPEVFGDLAGLTPGHGGEVQLTDAIDLMARRSGALGLITGHDLFDTGNPRGLLEATLGLASADQRLAEAVGLPQDRPG